jgi:gas vesicle protein
MAEFDRDEHEHEAGGGSFMMGLLTGTVLGAGLGMLLAPKSGSELRSQLGEKASSVGRAAGEQIRRAGDAAGGAMEKARENTQRAAEQVRGRVDQAMSSNAGTDAAPGTAGTGSMGSGSSYTGGTGATGGSSTYTGDAFTRDRDRDRT